MKLQYPGCLWAAAGILFIILLQFIRPRSNERTISTQWLWRLSERFRKKRLPIRRAKKLLLLALQLLTAAAAFLLLLQPLLPTKGQKLDFIAVMDISASMAMKEDTQTRLEEAVGTMLQDITALPDGSAVTIITAGNTPAVLLKRSRSLSEAKHTAGLIETDWSAGNLADAIGEAQNIVWAHPEAQVVLYTDQEAVSEGIQVTRTSSSAWNAAVTSFSSIRSGSRTMFKITLISCGQDADLTLALYLDGSLGGAKQVTLRADEPLSLDWEVTDQIQAAFRRARITFQADDALAEDNEAWCIAPPSHAVSVRLCSDSPWFWQHVLEAFPSVDLTVSPQAAWEDTFSGSDIYIFDGTVPKEIPDDGSLWLINPDRLPRETGLLYGALIQGGLLTTANDIADSQAAGLTTSLSLRDVTLQRQRLVTDTESFSVILTAGGNPALLARKENTGLSCMILPFDIHDSNLPLTADFVLLVRNMLSWTMPDMLSSQEYLSGEEVRAALLPLTGAAYLQTQEGTVHSLPFTSEGIVFTAGKPGVFTLLQERPGEGSRYADFSVRIPASESITPDMAHYQLPSLSRDPSLAQELSEQEDPDDGLLDIKYWLAGGLLLLLILEWMVYHYEHY